MSLQLWTKNFCLITLASTLGSAGAIAGGFALSFFVFDETGSTFASALVIAIQFVPYVFVPFAVAPLMDRLPRKAFLSAVIYVTVLFIVLWVLGYFSLTFHI